jgi:hypothetical protein
MDTESLFVPLQAHPTRRKKAAPGLPEAPECLAAAPCMLVRTGTPAVAATTRNTVAAEALRVNFWNTRGQARQKCPKARAKGGVCQTRNKNAAWLLTNEAVRIFFMAHFCSAHKTFYWQFELRRLLLRVATDAYGTKDKRGIRFQVAHTVYRWFLQDKRRSYPCK